MKGYGNVLKKMKKGKNENRRQMKKEKNVAKPEKIR